MVGFILLRFFILFFIAPVFLGYLAWGLFRRNPKEISEREVVMIPDGRHGEIIEKIVYEDITLYGVRIENQILHFERHQLVRRKTT